MAQLTGYFQIDASDRASEGTRSQPSTPISRSRDRNRSRKDETTVPFRIPSTERDTKQMDKYTKAKVTGSHSTDIPKKKSRSRSVLTNSPPSPARSISLNIVTTQRISGDFSNDSLSLGKAPPTVSSPSPSRRRLRVPSFTHVRCLNCDQQFVVHKTPRSSSSSSNSEDFCSGECRCSFLATGIDQQYFGYRQERSSESQTFVLNSSDDEDMNVDSDEDDDYD